MFNQNQMNPYHYFSSIFGVQPLFWPQMTQHFDQSLRNTIIQKPLLFEKQNVSIKIQPKQQIEDYRFVKETAQPKSIVTKSKQFLFRKRKQCKKIKKRYQSGQEGKIIQRNQTKNISKNFGKAILAFAKTFTKFSQQLLKKYDVERQYLINYIKKARKDLNSLYDLREMWGADNQNDKLKKCLRIISYSFMRKHCLSYIFNSRIKSVGAHTKYRHRLMEGMRNPSQFLNIKQN